MYNNKKTETTRMQFLEEQYPNLEFTNGEVVLYKRHSRDTGTPEEVFRLPIQCVEYLKEGILVLRVSKTVKEIFSIIREEVIANIPSNAQIQIITEDQKLIGFLITTFTNQEVLNKSGEQICFVKNDEAILQPTELLGSRTVFIKKTDQEGHSTLISFKSREELRVDHTDILNFRTFNGENIISIERGETTHWYKENLKEIGKYDTQYHVINLVNRITNQLGKRLPDWMPVEKTWIYDPIEKENYPHYKVNTIEWERHDSILLDESKNIFYLVRPNSGDVEVYSYSGEQTIKSIGKFKSSSEIPVLELKN